MIFLKKILVLSVALVVSVESFTLQQVKDSESIVFDCMIKIGISPLSVNQLRKGDLSRNDEKSQVSRCSELNRFYFY